MQEFTYTIEDWHYSPNKKTLEGIVYSHPHFGSGMRLRLEQIIEISLEGRTARTKNAIIKLGRSADENSWRRTAWPH